MDGTRQLGLRVRAGLHAGECDRRGNDLSGLAVHVAARIAGAAAPGEVLVTRTVKDLVAGGAQRFLARGRTTLRGPSEEWEIFAAVE